LLVSLQPEHQPRRLGGEHGQLAGAVARITSTDSPRARRRGDLVPGAGSSTIATIRWTSMYDADGESA